jgi:hydroxymethylpyrimidine pyrophosphatase-like HAD family hydrolase
MLMKNNRIIIFFDVDGTLITDDDKPRWNIINFLKIHHEIGNYIILGSRGGLDYAKMWARKLFLEDYINEYREKKFYDDIDIVYDDEVVELGKINILVPREN